ncbi:MAG: hypothetical protein KKA19_06270 [Candidatus Margulisbacteria bacterium]|nr:hypothetical protein [Candidatus Margulisiibacteriota bacterium]
MAKTAQIQLRTTPEIKTQLEEKAKNLGYSSLSEYIIFVALNAEVKVTAKKK